MHLWGAEPLITVNDRDEIDTSTLVRQAEAYSLYVLSQLEIQNISRDTLVFSTDVDERIRACITELNYCQPHERLFVWETAPVMRKEKSYNELKLLVAVVLILILCGLYKNYRV
jgi:hypothetical protein